MPQVLAGRFDALIDWPLIQSPVIQWPLLAVDDRMLGQGLFITAFVLLILLLWRIPADRLGHEQNRPVWWGNVRLWAILIAATQIVVYAVWGYRD